MASEPMQPESAPLAGGGGRRVAFPDRDRFCRKCGYNLRGLTAWQCPECGQAFDPGRPSSYRETDPALVRLPRPRKTLAALGALAVVLLLGHGAGVVALASRHDTVVVLWVLAFPVWTFACGYLAVSALPENRTTESVFVQALVGLVANAVSTAVYGPCAIVAGGITGAVAGMVHRRWQLMAFE
jgi:hypothetical protein